MTYINRCESAVVRLPVHDRAATVLPAAGKPEGMAWNTAATAY